MTSPIDGLSFPVVSAAALGGISPTAAAGETTAASGTQGAGFASVLASTFDQLQATQSASDVLATQAATGDLKDVHDYMIAGNEAKLATEMVVTVKNKAVEAFTEIMRMPV